VLLRSLEIKKGLIMTNDQRDYTDFDKKSTALLRGGHFRRNPEKKSWLQAKAPGADL
jgi:hypothetical protein